MIKERLDGYIEDSREDMIKHILDIISYHSFTGDQIENEKCFRHVLDLAEDMGFKTMTTSDRSVGIVEMGEGEECLGILVHVDVVGVGDEDKWTHGPFNGVQKDGFLWGRGTSDDKGAVIMSLFAMKAVMESGVKLGKKVWLIIGTSEEGEWTDIQTFKREFPVPDYGFSPDGEFPIFNVEKGYADVVLSFHEPRLDDIVDITGGDSPNTVPSKAQISLSNGSTLTIHGVSTHSSTPEEGDNAIISLCLKLMDELGYDFNFSRFVTNHLRNEGMPVGLHIDDGGSFHENEHVGFTTAAPTVIWLEDGKLKLNINIRHRFGTDYESIFRAFEKKSGEYGFNFEINNYLEPMKVDRDLPFLQIMREVSEIYETDGSFMVASGSSYAKSMERFVSWGPVFPDDPQTAHVEDERLSVDTMLRATKLYAYFIYKITHQMREVTW